MISTPGIIFQWSAFKHGFLYEVIHSRPATDSSSPAPATASCSRSHPALWYGLGPALAILFASRRSTASCRLDRRALTILAFALPYYALISLSQVRFARYSLPLFPAAALLIAWMAVDLWQRFSKGLRWAWPVMLAASLIGTLLYAIALDRLFVQPPPQDRAARWIFANIPKGSRIGVFEVPVVLFSAVFQDHRLRYAPAAETDAVASPYRLRGVPRCPIRSPWQIVGPEPQWTVFSDYETPTRCGSEATHDSHLCGDWKRG